MLVWEVWAFLQAASSVGVLRKAYLFTEPCWFTPKACVPQSALCALGPVHVTVLCARPVSISLLG